MITANTSAFYFPAYAQVHIYKDEHMLVLQDGTLFKLEQIAGPKRIRNVAVKAYRDNGLQVFDLLDNGEMEELF